MGMETNGFKSLSLDQIIQSDIEKKLAKKKAHQQITFKEYVDTHVKKDPLIAQNSAARLLEIILDSGVEVISEEDQLFSDVQERYSLFAKDLFGIDDAIARLKSHIQVGASRGSTGKQVLVLVGPPAAGKSTMVRILAHALEEYRKRPIFMIKGCPKQEEPLHLLPRHLREQFSMRAGDCPDCSESPNPNHYHMGVKIEGDLCPVCRHTLTEFTDKDTGVVRWWDVPVETFTFSKQARRGIGSFEPSDEKSSDMTTLTGTENIGMSTAYGKTDYRAYELTGEIPAAERGFVEGREIFSSDPQILGVFFSVAEEREMKVPGSAFPHVSVDIVIIGHTNLKVWKDFNGKKEYEGLHDRFTIVPVRYPLRIRDEVALYRKLIERESDFKLLRKCHIAPGVLELAALFAVMTRYRQSNFSIDELTKAKFYNGDRAITMLRDKDRHPVDVRQLIEEGQSDSDISKREGMFGISSRTVLSALNNAIAEESSKTEKGCLTPLKALMALRKGFDHRMGVTPEQIEAYRALLTANETNNVMAEYKNFVVESLTRAYVAAYHDQAAKLFNLYIDEVELERNQKRKFVRGQTMSIERTKEGKPREIDYKFLHGIEKHLGWDKQQAEVARGEVLEIRGSTPDFSFDTYPPLARACEKRLIDDSRTTLSLILKRDRVREGDEDKRYKDLYTGLKEAGFCDLCAEEATEKATEFLRD